MPRRVGSPSALIRHHSIMVPILIMTYLVASGCGDTSTAQRDKPKSSAAASVAAKGEAPITPSSSPPPSLATNSATKARVNADETIARLEKDLADPTKKRVSLLTLIQIATGEGLQLALSHSRNRAIPYFLKAGQSARVLRDSYPDLVPVEKQIIPNAFYNEACALALSERPDQAVKALEESIEAGFQDILLASQDSELASVHERPDFKALIERSIDRTIQADFDKFKTFRFDFNLPDTKDKPHSLKDYRGKVLIVDFWGTWCPPCLQEIPLFIELVAKYRDQGLEMIGVNYEQVEPKQVKRTIDNVTKTLGINYVCVIGDSATQSRVPDLSGYPTTLFLDRAGVVRLRVTGARPRVYLEAVVKRLLAEEPREP